MSEIDGCLRCGAKSSRASPALQFTWFHFSERDMEASVAATLA